MGFGLKNVQPYRYNQRIFLNLDIPFLRNLIYFEGRDLDGTF